MKPDMLDRHALDALEKEYVELYLADLTDDVDVSMSTQQRRDTRLAEIQELVGKFLASEWSRKTEQQAKKVGYASGAPWDGE